MALNIQVRSPDIQDSIYLRGALGLLANEFGDRILRKAPVGARSGGTGIV